MSEDELPLGIFLLALLQGLQALGLLLVGGLWLLLPILGFFIAIPFGIAGLFGLFIAIGLFTLQDYAWNWSFILNVIGLAMYILSLNPLGAILSVVIVLYLNLPHIKNKFNME